MTSTRVSAAALLGALLSSCNSAPPPAPAAPPTPPPAAAAERAPAGPASIEEAAALGDVVAVRRFLGERANPDAALRQSAARGDLGMVTLLLENGANVRAADAKRVTALHLAVKGRHLEVVRTLLATGADLDAKDEENGLTPLMVAAQAGSVPLTKLLLAAGADPTPRDRFGDTADAWAQGNGQAEIARMIREARRTFRR